MTVIPSAVEEAEYNIEHTTHNRKLITNNQNDLPKI